MYMIYMYMTLCACSIICAWTDCVIILLDPTLTLENISTVTATVPLEGDELGGRILLVPVREREEIRQQSSTAAEERERLISYYLNYSEYASWADLAGRLYRGQHHDALSAARRFIKTEPGEFVCNNIINPWLLNDDTVDYGIAFIIAVLRNFLKSRQEIDI